MHRVDALEFLRSVGSAEAARVAEQAGTNFAYFRQIAHGHRRPSVDLAQRLVEASGQQLEFTKLLLSSKRSPHTVGRIA